MGMPCPPQSELISLSLSPLLPGVGQVRGTGGSSATSKRSAAQLGYTEDRFILRLVPRAGRRAPAIHR